MKNSKSKECHLKMVRGSFFDDGLQRRRVDERGLQLYSADPSPETGLTHWRKVEPKVILARFLSRATPRHLTSSHPPSLAGSSGPQIRWNCVLFRARKRRSPHSRIDGCCSLELPAAGSVQIPADLQCASRQLKTVS